MGTPQEFVLLMLIDRLELIEHARFRALAQITVDKEEGVKAFESYMQIAFPGMTMRQKRKDDDTREALKKWVNSGPIAVTPLPMPTIKSRMKLQVAKVRSDQRGNELYGKLGSAIR